MTAPVIYASNLAFLGFAKETTYGTAVGAPTVWVPIDGPSWKALQKQLSDEALRGNMNTLQGVVAGTRSDTIDYSTYIYLDSIFPHLMAILGAPDTKTGTADPYTHATSVYSTSPGQPPSFTIWYMSGAECWQTTGSVLAKLDIDWKAEDLAKVTAGWMALPATQVTTPTNTPSTSAPHPSWNTTITVNSVAYSHYSDVKVTLARACKVVQTADGTQAPYIIFGGPVTADIDLTGVYQGHGTSPDDLAKLLANTQQPITIQSNPAGDSTHNVKLQATLAAPKDSGAEIKSAAGDYVQIAGSYNCVANATDATSGGVSCMKATVTNAVSTTY